MKRLPIIALIFIALSGFVFAGPEALNSSGKEMKATVSPPACDFSWTGFYVGARDGYGWSDDSNVGIRLFNSLGDFTFDPDHQHLDSNGFIGGGEFGFNWQIGKRFVLGAEADFSGSTIGGHSTDQHRAPQFSTPGNDTHLNQEMDWLGTIRGRVGFVPWCRLMIYGTGGFAFANVDNSGDVDFRPFGGVSHIPASHNDTETGWTAGGGLEYAISRHWTVKVEYLYVDLSDSSATGTQIPNLNIPSTMIRYHWDNAFHTVSGGLNFKF